MTTDGNPLDARSKGPAAVDLATIGGGHSLTIDLGDHSFQQSIFNCNDDKVMQAVSNSKGALNTFV